MVRFFRRRSRDDEEDDAFADADGRGEPNGGTIGFDSSSATSPIVPPR